MPCNSPFVGGCGKCAPHPTSLRSATFPLWGKALHIVRFTVPHYCKKIPPARGLRAAPGARVKKEVLKKIVAVEIVDARRDHIIVDILRQTVGPFRIQKTVHPFGQSVQLQHCNPVSFPSVGQVVWEAFRFPCSVFIICERSDFCKLHFVQTYKSYLYIFNYFGKLYICTLRLCALRGQFLPCLLHGISREEKLAALGKYLDVAADVSELLGHGMYRLSYLVCLYYTRWKVR